MKTLGNVASTLKLGNIKSNHAPCHCGAPYSAAPGCNCFASSVRCDQESLRPEDNSPKASISVDAQDLCADRNPENVHAKDSSRQVSLSERERGYFYTLTLWHIHSMHACLYGATHLCICMQACILCTYQHECASVLFLDWHYVSRWIRLRRRQIGLCGDMGEWLLLIVWR